MNTASKLLMTFGTLAFLGIGIGNSAYADETITKENLQQEHFFEKYDRQQQPLFFGESAPATKTPAVLRSLPVTAAPALNAAVDPHWGPAQDATDN